jgi:DMSO/TMAO reductase YedYZ molybdopterin-dependent catalytic subunit
MNPLADVEVDHRRIVVPVPSRGAGAAAGLVGGGLAVAVGTLCAGVIDVVSPIDAVGSTFIDNVPTWLKEWAIRQFGTNDKIALRVGIFTVMAIAAVVIGIAARRRAWIGVGGVAAFGLIGAIVAVRRPGESASAALPSLLGAVVGCVVLHRLLHPSPSAPRETPGPSQVPLGWDRRRFLVTTASTAAVAATAAAGATVLEGRRIDSIESAIPESLPPVASSDAAAPTDGSTDSDAATLTELRGITPFVTPNNDFYRIDTALSFPRINLDSWSVQIGGLVERPVRYTYADLQAMPQVEHMVTLCCVSNQVGGPYIGNAVWQGVSLKSLLEEAGVQDGAEQLFSTSVDGWTCGFPIELALDGRDALLAIGMNGEPLPLAHGFPARLVVPGVYGYVSATKWIESIEVTTWDGATGYWIPRGWSRLGPIKTQSRIDVPRREETLTTGPNKIAGVAWAQHRGIAKVEVRVDDGDWMTATLGEVTTDDSWCQWVVDWDATAGEHVLQVRATDKDGDTQTEEITAVDPDGATGYHTRRVNVRD